MPDFVGGVSGRDGGGAFKASCCGAGFVFASVFVESAGFASASLAAGALFGASASFGASAAGAALAAFDGTLSGADAANRSLNIVGEIAATVTGFSTTGSAAKASPMICAVERDAILGLTTGSS